MSPLEKSFADILAIFSPMIHCDEVHWMPVYEAKVDQKSFTLEIRWTKTIKPEMTSTPLQEVCGDENLQPRKMLVARRKVTAIKTEWPVPDNYNTCPNDLTTSGQTDQPPPFKTTSTQTAPPTTAVKGVQTEPMVGTPLMDESVNARFLTRTGYHNISTISTGLKKPMISLARNDSEPSHNLVAMHVNVHTIDGDVLGAYLVSELRPGCGPEDLGTYSSLYYTREARDFVIQWFMNEQPSQFRSKFGEMWFWQQPPEEEPKTARQHGFRDLAHLTGCIADIVRGAQPLMVY